MVDLAAFVMENRAKIDNQGENCRDRSFGREQKPVMSLKGVFCYEIMIKRLKDT